MDTYQIMTLLFLAGSFVLSLLSYIDRHNRK